jgi:hypothetical protein
MNKITKRRARLPSARFLCNATSDAALGLTTFLLRRITDQLCIAAGITRRGQEIDGGMYSTNKMRGIGSSDMISI